MNRYFRFAIAAVLLGLSAAGAWACSDDGGDELTVDEYFTRVNKIDDDSTVRIDAIFANITDENDVNQTRDAFSKLPAEFDVIVVELEDIDPPEVAKDAHEKITEAMSNLAEAARKSVDSAKDAQTTDDFFAAVESGGFDPANDAFTKACKDLEQIAADNNITVDLGCDEDESAAVEEAVQSVAADWNAKDLDAFTAHFTDKGLTSAFGDGEEIPVADIRAVLAQDIGDGAIVIRSLDVEESETGADATVLWVSGTMLERLKFSLINEGDTWKIDGQEDVPIETPAGSTAVNVDLNEFAIGFDPATIPATGEYHFAAKNVGTQQHHLVLAKIPQDANLEELLASEEDPPGVEDFGATHPFEPGQGGDLVLAGRLEPGRYVMVCFLPDTTDPEGTPHALKGMVKDFTVQ